ncbi:MAG: hypothetical protein KF729_03560 [Sandaracinaceae bacterium]|nr:hypothetical protein [Sandaracinaceae bacterium]
MLDRRAAWSLPALFAAVALACWLAPRLSSPAARRAAALGAAPSSPRTSAAPPAAAPARPLDGVRWIVAGGGPSPELNQLQIEQDLLLARDVFTGLGEGLVLFAGGPSGAAVQELRADADADPLRARLGELFDPRGGRDARYRRPRLAAGGAATEEALLEALRGAILEPDAPLTMFLAGHGVGGETPGESRFLTWGNGAITVDALAQILDEAPGHRPVRMVITSCRAGGFAELVFAGGYAEQGPAQTDRCGFFATTWDRDAAGCDSSPDRAAHEGYGIHFLSALRGQDRDGGAAMDAIDLDRDGTVSLLEAHTRARIASGSFDVPVTTSEHYLRAVAPEEPPRRAPAPAALPAERAVVRGLAARLGLARPEDVSARLDAVHSRIEPLVARLDAIDEEIARAREALAAELLHRWPVLDDPWHPDFEVTLGGERAAIEAYLAASDAATRAAELAAEREPLAATHDDLVAQAAPMERLERALETLELAARLEAEGGRHWLRYQRFVACESGRP